MARLPGAQAGRRGGAVISFWVNEAGRFGIEAFITQRAPALARRIRVRSYESLTAELEVIRGAHIFTALDQLGEEGRATIATLYDALADQCPGDRLLNDPRRALRRYELLETVHRAGINQFQARRAGDSLAGARYPVFVREETGHNGAVTGLLRNPGEVSAALRALRARGFRQDNLLVVEFCDLSDSGGTFWMGSALALGSHMVPSFLLRGRHWVLKWDESEKDLRAMQDFIDYVNGNPHEAWLRRVVDLAGVDYGRVDYGVGEKALQVWEINLGPTIGPTPGKTPPPLPSPLEEMQTEGRRTYTARVEQAFGALDPELDRRQVTIRLDPARVSRFHAGLAAGERRHAAIDLLKGVYHHPVIGRPFRALYSWMLPRR